MTLLNRPLTLVRRLALPALAVALLGLPVPAQEAPQEPAGEEVQETRKERRARERQERIDAWRARKAAKEAQKAKKKAERDAEKEAKRLAKEAEEAAERREQDEAQADDKLKQMIANAEAEKRAAQKRATAQEAAKQDEGIAAELAEEEDNAKGVKLPKKLVRSQDNVRASEIGSDPTVRRYLQLIDEGKASPQQLGAVANFIADVGMVDEALTYYRVALSRDKKDPLLWLNYGTLERRSGDRKGAASAFARALSLDPNNARAHYNLGAVFDEMGKYEDAIEEYKLALTLDPQLGDPSINPQAANNERLVAVKLLLFQEGDGGLVLPLTDLPDGTVDR